MMTEQATGEIDQAAVEAFLAGAAGATREQVEMVAGRLEAQARRGERAMGPTGPVSCATMAEAARRLRSAMAPAAPVAAPAAPVTPPGKTRIRISAQGRHFDGAVRDAKRAGGTYDGQSRTWLIPSSSTKLNAPGAYGWAIVERN